MCVSALGNAPVSTGTLEAREDIRSLELELQVVVNHHVGSGNRTLYLLDMENNTIMNSVDMCLF